MKIIAIDPGYDRLGLAILEKEKNQERLLFSECYSPTKKIPDEERIYLVGQRIKECIEKYKPEALALENLFFNKNQKTAFLIAEVRGVIIYEALSQGLKVRQFTPLQIKTAVTGYGKSDKKHVSDMVKKLIKIEKTEKIIDDEYDAIAVGLTYFATTRFNL